MHHFPNPESERKKGRGGCESPALGKSVEDLVITDSSLVFRSIHSHHVELGSGFKEGKFRWYFFFA